MATKKAEEAEVKNGEKFLVILEPPRDNEENYQLVGVNGNMTKIMKGVPVYVSREIKEVLDNAKIAKKVMEANQALASTEKKKK